MKRTYDANNVARPMPVLGLRPRLRLNGEKYLVHVCPEALNLDAGDELHLRRVASDDDAGDVLGCTHVLQVVRHVEPWTPTKAHRAEAVRLDGLGLRMCADQEAMP